MRVSAQAKAKKAAYDREYRARNAARIDAQRRAYRVASAAQKSAYDRERRIAMADELSERRRAHYAATRPQQLDYMRRKHIQRTHGISLEEKLAILLAQGGRCAICQDTLEPDRSAHMDHDHATGRLRGVLCQRCNMGLGCFRDRPELLRAAIAYLQDFEIVPASLGDDEREHAGRTVNAGRLSEPLTA